MICFSSYLLLDSMEETSISFPASYINLTTSELWFLPLLFKNRVYPCSVTFFWSTSDQDKHVTLLLPSIYPSFALSINNSNVFKPECTVLTIWCWLGLRLYVPVLPRVFATVSKLFFSMLSYAFVKGEQWFLLSYLENVAAASVCFFLACIPY